MSGEASLTGRAALPHELEEQPSLVKVTAAGLQVSGGDAEVFRTAWMVTWVELPCWFELLACPADRFGFGTIDASGTTGASGMCFLLLTG